MPSPGFTGAASRVIDSRPLYFRQYLLLALCGSVIFLDGLDTQSISIVTRAMSASLHVSISSFGVVCSALQLGGLLCAFLFGYLADRLGRRPLVVTAALLVGMLTFGTAFVGNYTQLIILRFLAGIGLGGIFPCVLALGAEFLHSRSRGLAIAILFANYSLGAALGAVIDGYVLARLGWRAIFVANGVLSMIAALAIMVWLPAPPRFLLSKGRIGALRQIFRQLFPSQQIEIEDLRIERMDVETANRAKFKKFLAGGPIAVTLLLLSILLLSYATIKVMPVWLNPLLQTAGIPAVRTTYVLAALDMGSMLGLGFAGYLVTRFGPTRSLAPALAVLGAAVVMMALQVARFAVLLPSGFMIGFAGGVGQSAPLALFATIYPTRLHSTALRCGSAAGQIGKICSPMLVGAVPANGWRPDSISFAVALLPLLGLIMTIGLALSGVLVPSPVPCSRRT
jgi:AAHS family 4-hydroxybenzoate transporter-like MFS transporter